jgi:lipoprotein-anchoring transpeptidase ErfK/SrfK
MIAPLGSMIAFSRAFEHAGRTWLVSADGSVVPADRVRPYRISTFHGVVLGKGSQLPLAWARERDRPRFRRTADGAFVEAGSAWSVRSPVALATGEGTRDRGFLMTRERTHDGERLWIEKDDATVVLVESPPSRVVDGEKWISVHVRAGTLVAYEGEKPVFATLISPGAGGVSRAGVDDVKASTTPRGSYRIQHKYRAQTMSPDKDKPETQRTFFFSEVPYAQYFRIPFALHTAYWHESFGEWMSGGCVNLSPRDGQWLFTWTDPALPDGWDTVSARGGNGTGTVIVVER